MIVNFSVQNFGSIKDKQTLSFEATKSTELEDYYVIEAGGLRLLKMALIYGANASGKTTVLNALEFLKYIILKPANKKTDELEFYPFLLNPQTPFENSLVAIEFIKSNIRYAYEVEFNKKAIVREELNYFKPNKANIYKRTTDIDKELTKIKFGSKIKISPNTEKVLEGNTLWNNTALGGFLKTNVDLHELKEVTDWFKVNLSSLIRDNYALEKVVALSIENYTHLKSDIINLLKKADLNISDAFVVESSEVHVAIDFLDKIAKSLKMSSKQVEQAKADTRLNSIQLEFEHTVNDIKYRLPIELESQGTKRYYAFGGLLSMLIRYSHIAPIDELESSLHPDLYMHFLLTFLANAKNSQLIATTHNREILNNKDVFRNDAIWFTDKGEDAATRLYSLADFDTKTIRDTTNVYNAYKTGKLGGVPKLGDYYIDLLHEEDTTK